MRLRRENSRGEEEEEEEVLRRSREEAGVEAGSGELEMQAALHASMASLDDDAARVRDPAEEHRRLEGGAKSEWARRRFLCSPPRSLSDDQHMK